MTMITPHHANAAISSASILKFGARYFTTNARTQPCRACEVNRDAELRAPSRVGWSDLVSIRTLCISEPYNSQDQRKTKSTNRVESGLYPRPPSPDKKTRQHKGEPRR